MSESMLETNGVSLSAFRPSVEEIGTTGIRYLGRRLDEEFENAWRQARKSRTIREMLVDPMISRSIWTFELLIRNALWSFQPVDDSNEAILAAQFADEVLFQDQSHSWDEILSNHLSFIAWGWAWHELVWKRRQGVTDRRDPGMNSRFNDGRWGLRKTAFRGQNTLWEWDLTEYGDIRAMIQMDTYAHQHRGTVTLPIDQSLLFRMSSYRSSPEGRSLLRGAYIPWYRKKNIATLQGIGIERDLAGLPFIRVPANIISPTTAAETAAKAAFERMARNIRNDDQAYVMLPSTRDDSGEFLYDFTLLSASGSSSKMDTQTIIDGYNKEIVIALMTDIILIGHEQVGSLALHSSATELLSYGIGGIMNSICEVYNRHFMPRLWAFNGLPVETMPRLIHGDIETVDLGELGNFISNMGRGGLDFTDIDTENEIRRRSGFPLKQEEVL